MGLTPSGAVFERAYRVEAFSVKCEHLLSCFFSPFGDWRKFSSVSSFKYCTYSYLKEYQFRQKVQHKYADMAELADAIDSEFIGGEIMSYSVSGTMITLTRGDTFSALITITDLNDNQYIPMNGDRIRFAMKNDYNDETPLLIKEIPIDTMILTLNPEDTKHLPFGKYVYDIELTKATGEVDTFITKAILKLTEEVH